jgi:tetratricopeptide (TPR) repeat protein
MDTPNKTTFEAGAIFYTEKEGQFSFFKLIKHDEEFKTYHVKVYSPVDTLPKKEDLDKLEIMAYHAPIDKDGFENPQLFSASTIEDNDLIGYLEYIKQTGNIDEVVQYASKYYEEAYQLNTQKEQAQAILKYSKAIELIPNFFEAIDNRAFCKMDLGLWAAAIEDFNLSLKINPDSFLAIFSIGECYFKTAEYEKAKNYFEQAAVIDPNHELPKQFLAKTIEQMAE